MMQQPSRRTFLRATSLGLATAAAAGPWNLLTSAEEAAADGLSVAPFRCDVTPPMGHSLCGGLVQPAKGVDDPLEAIGFVLSGAGEPIVVCSVDWTGILNSAHVRWREALARAAGTRPERVAVQCVHQHNAPFVCLEADRIVRQHDDLEPMIDPGFFATCLERAARAVREALPRARRVTHVAASRAPVDRVASNRRVIGEDGKIAHWRGSRTNDPALRELPEGLVDPWLRTVALCDGARPVVACHYYATHPMSYYGDGRVSSDFVGLARKRLQEEDPQTTHIYFTGCAGNIAAGKYNDGSKATRLELTRRMIDALAHSVAGLRPRPLHEVRWSTATILPPPRTEFPREQVASFIASAQNPARQRNRQAYVLAWIERHARGTPIVLSALRLGEATLLHLPAESFIEYQLFAQSTAPDRLVATAAYGDGGPWYLPTRAAYPQGGYEVSVAFCDPQVEPILRQGIRAVLA